MRKPSQSESSESPGRSHRKGKDRGALAEMLKQLHLHQITVEGLRAENQKIVSQIERILKRLPEQMPEELPESSRSIRTTPVLEFPDDVLGRFSKLL